MSAEDMNPELSGVEAALHDLQPAPSGIDRDRLMFLAGQSQGTARVGIASLCWPLATAALVFLSIGLGALAYQNREPRIVYVPAPAEDGRADRKAPEALAKEAVLPPGSDKAVPPGDDRQGQATTSGYVALRKQVLEGGVDAIPESQAFRQEPAEVSAGDHRLVLQWVDG